MMEDFIGTYGNRLIVAVVGVGVALLVLAIVLWLLRRRGGASPFIRGGRNRQPRLQILDAAAVDARRRLVLVRRDDVEHLVMIGGPTDIVIESGIGAVVAVAPVHAQEGPVHAAPSERPASRPAEPRPPQAVAPERRPSPPPVQAPAPVPAPVVSAPVPVRPVVPAQMPTPQPIAPQVSAVRPSAPDAVIIPPAPAPSVRPEPPQLTERPVVRSEDAGDILDAARERVLPKFPQSPAAEPVNPAERPAPVVFSDVKLNEQASSEFERILEAEMANAQKPDAPQPGTAFQQPRREPAVPPISGATPDGDVQKEMARIFGEISVGRDK